MHNTSGNKPKKKRNEKTFDVDYVFGGTWIGPNLCGAKTLKCTFTLSEIKRFGVKNVIKYYAIKFGIGEKKYNCFISNFGKNELKKRKEKKHVKQNES